MSTIKDVFGIDLRTLALFRVCLGLWLIVDLIIRAGHLTAHYTDFGVLPRAEAISYISPWRLSIHLINGSTAFQAILFILAGVFALCLVLGYRTRIATIVSWVLLLSLQNRNPILLNGGDNLALMLLFWGMFLPLGARFSIDEALNSRTEAVPNSFASVATMAILVQCMSVYFFSAFLKSGPEWMPDGTAVYYALHVDRFASPLAAWFRQFDLPMRGLTYFVWWLELIGPLLMFSPFFRVPLRLFLMFLFISMHVGFIFFLHIGLFSYISITSLLLFSPSWLWERIGPRLRSPERLGLRMYYDGDCGFCRKTCLLLRTFLLLRETPITAAQEVEEIHRTMIERDSWVVIDHDGQQYVRWRAVALVFRRSFLFWALGALVDWVLLRPLGDRIYGLVAKHRRGALGSLSARLLPYRAQQITPSWGANLVVGLFMIFVLSKNVVTLTQVPYDFPQDLRPIVSTLRLDQIWDMFAPHPFKTDGWYTVRGELRDGTVVDVINRVDGEPNWDRPAHQWPAYRDDRWSKYLERVRLERYQQQLLNYGRYLCRSWNKDATSERQLLTYEIYFTYQRTQPDDQEADVNREAIWHHDCFAPYP